jgi:hypothetical protein
VLLFLTPNRSYKKSQNTSSKLDLTSLLFIIDLAECVDEPLHKFNSLTLSADDELPFGGYCNLLDEIMWTHLKEKI